jgi:hypothetical protein
MQLGVEMDIGASLTERCGCRIVPSGENTTDLECARRQLLPLKGTLIRSPWWCFSPDGTKLCSALTLLSVTQSQSEWLE